MPGRTARSHRIREERTGADHVPLALQFEKKNSPCGRCRTPNRRKGSVNGSLGRGYIGRSMLVRARPELVVSVVRVRMRMVRFGTSVMVMPMMAVLVVMVVMMSMMVIVMVIMAMIMMVIMIMVVTMLVIMMMVMMVMIVMMVMMVMIVVMIVMMIMMVIVIMVVMMPVVVVMIMIMGMAMAVVVMMLMRVRLPRMDRVQTRLPMVHVLVGGTRHDAQHVRLVRQVARPGAVADRFDNHRRQPFGKFVDDAGDDAGSRRRRHFHRVRGRRDRQAAHHFQRRRRGHRVQAVIAAHRPGSEGNGGAINEFRLQRIERQRHADDVDDRVDRTDFMEMDFLHRNAVNFAFGNADLFKNRQAVRGNPLVESGLPDHADDVRIMPVMRRRMVRIELHVHLQRRDAFLVYPAPIQLERLDADFGKLALDITLIGSGIDQRGQRHVAANAGEAIEVYNSHVECHDPFDIFLLIKPAL